MAKTSILRPGCLLVAVALAAIATPALAQEAKWGPHIDVEAKPGTKRALGEGDAFIPLAQDGATLLFANLRYRFDDDSGNEGNYGLGLRHMLDSGWNIGAYGYFDRRRTPHDNYFNQVTVGLEALSQDWDLRANYYAPVGRRSHIVDGQNTVEVSGTTVLIRGPEEHSMGGFDAELGWRVPLFDASADRQFRIFGGAYHFSESNMPDISGPRARAELTFDSVPGLWEGSRLSLGAEWQHDDPRGSQGFLTARLRIPLQVYGKPAAKLTPMERRMADPVVRDIDVVSQVGEFSPPEVAMAANGGAVAVISSSGFSGASLDSQFSAAGTNATIILSGTFNTTAESTMLAGQTLRGPGSMTVRSASGRTATLTTTGTGTITGAVDSSPTVVMANNTTISGLTISNTHNNTANGAVRITSGSNFTILNSTIMVTATSNTDARAIVVAGNVAGVTIRGNTLTATANGFANVATGLQIFGGNATNVTVAGNTFTVSGASFESTLQASNTTFNADSTGNVVTNAATPSCSSNTGQATFTNGATC